jgi:hypothetical protein
VTGAPVAELLTGNALVLTDGVVIGTPTFRAGARYAAAGGYDVAALNAAAVEHHVGSV